MHIFCWNAWAGYRVSVGGWRETLEVGIERLVLCGSVLACRVIEVLIIVILL